MIGLGDSIRLFYRNYVNFEGRATRAEYWWPTLMQVVIYMVLLFVFIAYVGASEAEVDEDIGTEAIVVFGIGVLFYLVNLIPGIAVKVRRFHDLGQTGWLVLVFWAVNLIVPFAEFGRMIWFAFQGEQGSNQYGPDPHGYNADIFE